MEKDAWIDSLRSITVKNKVSYFGHRIDTVQKWLGTTLTEYSKASKVIADAELGLSRATLFVTGKDGWEEDRRLSDAWTEFSAYVERENHNVSVKTTNDVSVNAFGVRVRSDTRIKKVAVSDVDYQRARTRFMRAIEWKILADQEALKKLKPIGYRQNVTIKLCVGFSNNVLTLHKEL